ncbi:MAG UNVERIFIED_CONTAM: GNAT family N-acetyltransferase [Rickettsiaceae bacterium]|jgi:GNAT superfamily N-acetyltransferase
MHEYDPGVTSFLTNKINEEFTKYGTALPFSLSKKDKDGNIIAAASGSIIYGAIYTDQLWVDPHHRKKGLGFEILDAIHNYGISKGCRIATVCTMSFQGAVDFYEKAGYVMDFERSGYYRNSSCVFLKRLL